VWWALSALGVGLIFAAFVQVLMRSAGSRESPPTASRPLLPARRFSIAVGQEAPSFAEAATLSFQRTTMAAYDLSRRNVEERRRLKGAQELLMWGAAVAVVGAIAYTWAVGRRDADGNDKPPARNGRAVEEPRAGVAGGQAPPR
jgi:hypothetical protein